MPDSRLRTHSGVPDGEGAAAGALSGGVVGGLIGLLGSILVPGLGPIVVGGVLASTLTGVGIGAATGGLIGALMGLGIPEADARHFDHGPARRRRARHGERGPRTDEALGSSRGTGRSRPQQRDLRADPPGIGTGTGASFGIPPTPGPSADAGATRLRWPSGASRRSGAARSPGGRVARSPGSDSSSPTQPGAPVRAIRVHAFGGTEQLRLEDVPVPTPGPGQALHAGRGGRGQLHRHLPPHRAVSAAVAAHARPGGGAARSSPSVAGVTAVRPGDRVVVRDGGRGLRGVRASPPPSAWSRCPNG